MSTTTESVAQEVETRPVGAGLALLPRVNLLPPEIAERRQFRRIQAGLGGSVAAALVIMGFLVVAAGHGVTDANAELASAKTENASLQSQTAKFSNVNAIYAAAAAAELQLNTAMGDEVRFSQMMNDFSLAIPSTVWVTNISMSAVGGSVPAAGTDAVGVGTFTATGVGFAHNDVGTWLEAIAGLRSYSDPYFASSSEALMGTRKIVNFTSTATINSNALSGRYSKPIGS